MIGKTNNFNDIYEEQIKYQNAIKEKYNSDFDVVPCDNPNLVSYHIQQLISEVGEVLASDKRWKTHRNTKVDLENKKEEIADCMIVVMNIAMFSGLSAEELFDTVKEKIKENFSRIEK